MSQRTQASARKSLPTTIARTLLGLVMFVFGLNGFLHFLPQPPLPGPAGAFIGALFGSGYLMYVVKAVEVAVGAALLANRFVPLALVVLAPITVNIVLFHAVLAPAGLGVPLLVLALHLGLAWVHRAAYEPLLRAKTDADAVPADRPLATRAAAT